MEKKLPRELILISFILVLATLPAMLDTTIVNIAVNKLAKQFLTGLEKTQWIVTGYVFALGIAVPFSAWLMRRFGGKKVMTGGLSLFLIGSFLAALSWSMSSLIVFRIIQGFASGLLIPTLTTVLIQTAEGKNIGQLISIVSIPIVFAPILGPVIGGLILQYSTWQWLFWVNLPLGVIALLLLQWKLPHFDAVDKSSKLDWLGILLLGLISGMSIFGVIKIEEIDGQTVGILSFTIAAIAFLTYIIYAWKKRSPALIPLDLFRSKNFSASFTLLFLAGFVSNGPMLLLPLFFQDVRGLNVITAALWLIPQGLGMLITRTTVGKLTDKIGARLVALPAILVVLLGTVPFVFFDAGTNQWFIWLTLLIRGMGIGGFAIPVMSDSYVGLEKSQIPAASVATRIIQNIGSAFGSGILATVVSSALKGGKGNVSSMSTAYHAGFSTCLVFMAISIIPAFFLSNKIRSFVIEERKSESL